MNNQIQHIALENARVPEQKEVMEKIQQANDSPFLPENLKKFGHHEPIHRQGQYWYITNNRWPYSNTAHHFLIISNQYWTSLEDINPEASQELISHLQWLQTEYSIPGGAFCMRFGEYDYNGSTVKHLHMHVIVPDITHPEYQPVRFKIGKNPT